eukprot:COSAG01_NODE_14457_length_1451_cov_2.463757_1_plen_205_part_10
MASSDDSEHGELQFFDAPQLETVPGSPPIPSSPVNGPTAADMDADRRGAATDALLDALENEIGTADSEPEDPELADSDDEASEPEHPEMPAVPAPALSPAEQRKAERERQAAERKAERERREEERARLAAEREAKRAAERAEREAARERRMSQRPTRQSMSAMAAAVAAIDGDVETLEPEPEDPDLASDSAVAETPAHRAASGRG